MLLLDIALLEAEAIPVFYTHDFVIKIMVLNIKRMLFLKKLLS